MEQIENSMSFWEVFGAVFLVLIALLIILYAIAKVIEVWRFELIDWRKDNKAGQTLLQNLALASDEQIMEEIKLLETGAYKYSRNLSIELYIALGKEQLRRGLEQNRLSV